ncbi:M15 family metallopeptidase [Stenotrophomonas rhizophila]|uniref:M15 family metallopeptidase n=1 Tax=Stenotrophomonas rhizophila TaxID=216778 RepID=UPI001E3F8E13|nr:M15 family metallopeptidase [Stenotrophomonas rhizophila]MCC7664082.1 D-alanyl-D-alanine carboxypeptidase family protein [Stenotrophomonas rhizophila]
MRRTPVLLINTADIELWPGGLLRARSNADARALARAQWVLRRKRDGRYLAVATVHDLLPLVPRLMREDGIAAALDALDQQATAHGRGVPGEALLPLSGLQQRLLQLGIDAEAYAGATGLALEAEPAQLQLAGFDRYRRPLWLRAGAARGWQRLQLAAAADGVALDAISGYRSHAYQLGIFERKRARGLAIADILTVNAAPGYSEHHSGFALDIGTPGGPPAEESFEHTAAFAWLQGNAARLGFQLSYPRGNPHGIVYEPWHWCWQPAGD